MAARLAQPQERLLRRFDEFLRVLLAHETALHDLLRGEDHLAQRRLVLHDLNVAVEVEQLGQSFIERDQVTDPVDGFELAIAHQLVGERDVVDLLLPVVEFQHPPEDAAVLIQAEVVGLKRRGDVDELLVVHQHGAQNHALGVDV